jgi:hypothetical protein
MQAWLENVYIVSISEYLHRYACILIVYYNIAVNLAAKLASEVVQ